MSLAWLVGGGKEAKLAQKRKEQISELYKYNPTTNIGSNSDLYEIIVSNNVGKLTLAIELKADFPDKAPEIRVLQRVSHPWVNQDMMVMGHNKLLVWMPQHNLGQIVHDIAMEFQRLPPTPLPLFARPNSHALSPDPAPVALLQASQAQLENVQLAVKPDIPVKTLVPTVADKFPELEAMSLQQLEDLLCHPDQLLTLASNQDSVRILASQRDECARTVAHLTHANMDRRQEYFECQHQAATIIRECEAKERELRPLEERMQAVSAKLSVPYLARRLKDAMSEAEREAEHIKRKFEAGEEDQSVAASHFATDFLKARMLYHKRAMKRERLLDGADSAGDKCLVHYSQIQLK